MTKEQLREAEEFLKAAASAVEDAESSLRYSVNRLRGDCKLLCEKNEMDAAKDTLEKATDLSLPEQLSKIKTIAHYFLTRPTDEVSSTERLQLNIDLSDAKAKVKVYTVMTSLDWLSYCYPNEKTNAPDARKDVW